MGQIKTFLFVSFFRKLIVHENLYFKLFCSSKIVNFKAVFAKFIAVQGIFHLVDSTCIKSPPPIFQMLATGLSQQFN